MQNTRTIYSSHILDIRKLLFLFFISSLCFLGTHTLDAKPFDAVVIDANDVISNPVYYHMFGMNFEFNGNTNAKLNDYDKMHKNSKFTLVRYPGGAAAEQYFNLQDPSYYTKYNSTANWKKVPAGKRLSEVTRKNYDLAIVIPTIRYRNDPSLGQKHAKQFVINLLRGKYGRMANNKLIVFEIGNEFSWVSSISAKQYGKVAAYILKGIKDGINSSGKSSTYRCRIAIQSGQWSPNTKYKDVIEASKEFAKYDRGRYAKYINYLSYHYYPWKVTDVLSIGTNRPRFKYMLTNIRKTWSKNAKVNRSFYLSEYNNEMDKKRNDPRKEDVGLRAPMTNMALFAEGLRGGVVLASNWNLIESNVGYNGTSFYKKANDINFLGIYYKWMRDNLYGSKLINNIRYVQASSQYINNVSESEFRNKRVYVEAFKVNKNKIVVFVHGQAKKNQYIDVKFKNFKISSIKGTALYTKHWDERDGSAKAYTTKSYTKIWGKNTAFTFSVNKRSQYEPTMFIVSGKPSYSRNTAQQATDELSSAQDVVDVKVIVAPMPVSNGMLNLRSNVALSEFHIISLQGGIIKMINQKAYADEYVRVDVRDIAAGTYLLRSVTEDGRDIVQKLVIL